MSATFSAHFATVTTTSPLTVTPLGCDDPVPAQRLSTYTPVTAGDWVAYVPLDRSADGSSILLVLGKPV